MREIKFRMWDVTSKKMLYAEDTDLSISFDGAICKNECQYYNKPAELMQSTGLFDKNGKEIYEGDIVRSDCYSANMSKHFEILFKKDGYFVSSEKMRQSRELWRIKEEYRITEWIKHLGKYNIEIIGNIYENPELLV